MTFLHKYRWQIVLGIVLISTSLLLYLLHFTLFHDGHHIWIFLLGDIAFVPIEVLLVSLILHKVLSSREKQLLVKKMNMVVGSYFSDFGNRLLGHFRDIDNNSANLGNLFKSLVETTGDKYGATLKALADHTPDIEFDPVKLAQLKEILIDKKQFLLDLLKNQNLLQHESFTDFLWALFHLSDELELRDDLSTLPETDREHLVGDIVRAYNRMLAEWLAYLKHLRADYPFLFSFIVRTNPFNSDASVVIRK